jgi:hypothetical protein
LKLTGDAVKNFYQNQENILWKSKKRWKPTRCFKVGSFNARR